jgi:hypothetical protein
MDQDQFIIGERKQVDRFTKAQRWRDCGRAIWQKPDGTLVHYLHFPEQIRALPKGSTLHVMGFEEINVEASGLSHLNIVPHPDQDA